MVIDSPVFFTGWIKKALERHAFIPYFQPIFESETERCIGAEVLIRWPPPGRYHFPRLLYPPGKVLWNDCSCDDGSDAGRCEETSDGRNVIA
ncbi:TPA: EAL domain-containing protein [Serratia liquefaciens]|nr:EAL domain-containing protein [Serratia liquefaciens]